MHLARNPSRRNDPVCKGCVGQFMAARLETHGARQVSEGCMEPSCTTRWPWEKVIAYFPPEKLEAFNLVLFEQWRADADLITCLSPTCNFTALIDPFAPGYPHVECSIPTCKMRFCASCRTPWHVDRTCAEVRAVALMMQISDPEKETLALMQSRDAKRCPNCQLVIEKDGGCPSMFCTGCHKHFHWDTAASAVPGAKKALPVGIDGQAFWQAPHLAACEADGGTRTQQGGDDEPHYVSDYLLELSCSAPGPLPTEEDEDL